MSADPPIPKPKRHTRHEPPPATADRYHRLWQFMAALPAAYANIFMSTIKTIGTTNQPIANSTVLPLGASPTGWLLGVAPALPSTT
jgi:hypothetical protein